ncbi:hypothetical protein PAMP_000333 [Pampus punctatissimus]
MDLQELTPDELAQMLAEGNPMLTVQKSCRMKEPTEQPSSAEDFLYPFSAEATLISFSMEMRREEDQEESGGSQEGEVREDGGTEENVCQTDEEEDIKEKDLLIVSMTKTSISVFQEEGAVSDTKRHWMFSSNMCLPTNTSEASVRRRPSMFLRTQTCEKQRLQQISKSDMNTLSFVFYMKGDRTKQLTFESALHRGWFIHIVNTTDSVEMKTLDAQQEDPSFLFIIQK